MEPIVLFAVHDLPALGIRHRDRVLFDPARSAFPLLRRRGLEIEIRNTGAVLGAFTEGHLQALTPVSWETLCRLAG